jgi:lipopolysaccharide transport system ATP-binding protein
MKDIYIDIKNLSLEFELFDSSKQSLKKQIIKRTIGGFVEQKDNKKTVIKALNNIDFKINSGDRVGILGHNGSGKSSLLQVIAGIYEPTYGKIDQNGSLTALLDINQGLDFEASGYENILLIGILNGYSLKEIKENLDAIIEFSGLGEFINMPIKNYSTGMVLRLAFASSTFKNQDIFLLDEWISVGDDDFLKKCEIRLGELIKDSEILVFATHDTTLLNKVCNKYIKLDSGKIVEQGKI